MQKTKAAKPTQKVFRRTFSRRETFKRDRRINKTKRSSGVCFGFCNKCNATTFKMTTTTTTITKYCCIFFVVMLLIHYVSATPMLYKKNPQQIYEADLVPVSSTVIPLTVLEVSYGLNGKPSEEYKKAYLKKLRKKMQHGADTSVEEDPDTLITISKKHHEGTKAKVKGIPNP